MTVADNTANNTADNTAGDNTGNTADSSTDRIHPVQKSTIEVLDSVLCRVPADSVYGQRTRVEILDHLDDGVRRAVAEGTDYDAALRSSAEAFGPATELEHDYYRDYTRSRYLLGGLIDREQWLVHRLAARVGAALIVVGVVLGWLVPTVAALAAGFGVLRVPVNATVEFPPGEMESVTRYAVADPLPITLLRLESWTVSPMRVLAALGLVLLIVGAAATLRRVHRDLARGGWIVGGALALLGGAFVLGTSSAASYADGLLASTLWPKEADHYDDAIAAMRLSAGLSWGLAGLSAVAGAWLWWRARQLGVANTVLLRQCAVTLVLLSAGVVCAAHPILLGVLVEQQVDVEAVAPAQLVGALGSDLLWFCAGVIAVLFAVVRLERVLEEGWRIRVGRGAVT